MLPLVKSVGSCAKAAKSNATSNRDSEAMNTKATLLICFLPAFSFLFVAIALGQRASSQYWVLWLFWSGVLLGLAGGVVIGRHLPDNPTAETWRPMSSAPKDGTVIEAHCNCGPYSWTKRVQWKTIDPMAPFIAMFRGDVDIQGPRYISDWFDVGSDTSGIDGSNPDVVWRPAQLPQTTAEQK